MVKSRSFMWKRVEERHTLACARCSITEFDILNTGDIVLSNDEFTDSLGFKCYRLRCRRAKASGIGEVHEKVYRAYESRTIIVSNAAY